ncbi:MAG: hypothetical protein ABJA18_11945 [bacterium]
MTQQNFFSAATKSNLAWAPPFLRIVFYILLILTSGILLTVDARAQGQTSPHSDAKPQAKKKLRVRVTKVGVIGVSLRADKAKLTDVVAELSKRLGAKILLGPEMAKQAITVEFSDLTLEPAMRLLAPHVYIDYEIKANAQPTPVGIYLLDYNDPDPARTAVVEGSSQAVLIQGNTEDEGEKVEVDRDDPLQIELDENVLTIKSNKQPLALVVIQIADLLGVPAGINYDSNEIVDLNIKDTPIEDVIPRLSPNVRLYVRADLTRSHRVPLRLDIVPPSTKIEGQ